MSIADTLDQTIHDPLISNHNPTSIQLHLITRRKPIYYQDDARLVAKIFEELDGHIFTGSLLIDGDNDVNAIAAQSLIGVTIKSEVLPKSLTDRVATMRAVTTQITWEDFQRRRETPMEKVVGERCCVLSELEFVTGELLFLEFNEVALGAMGERSVLQHLFSRPSLFCRTLEGGYSVWNTAHIVSWSHYPKLDTPPSAWSAKSVARPAPTHLPLNML
ncbi:MAG: hypothetical protein ABL962_13670 [Fimbriimonadaceae bacterium]